MQGYNCIIIYNKDENMLLFCKRMKEPYKGKLNLVGGKIESGEDSFVAAYRELREETGIDGEDVSLRHMMDFTYYNQDCYVEVYVGTLNREKILKPEQHPLIWLSTDENFFDLNKFAGEGNIGHMMEQVKEFGRGIAEI